MVNALVGMVVVVLLAVDVVVLAGGNHVLPVLLS